MSWRWWPAGAHPPPVQETAKKDGAERRWWPAGAYPPKLASRRSTPLATPAAHISPTHDPKASLKDTDAQTIACISAPAPARDRAASPLPQGVVVGNGFADAGGTSSPPWGGRGATGESEPVSPPHPPAAREPSSPPPAGCGPTGPRQASYPKVVYAVVHFDDLEYTLDEKDFIRTMMQPSAKGTAFNMFASAPNGGHVVSRDEYGDFIVKCLQNAVDHGYEPTNLKQVEEFQQAMIQFGVTVCHWPQSEE